MARRQCQVTDAAYRPVAGATVLFTEYNGPEAASYLEEMRLHGPDLQVGGVRTSEDGAFRLHGVTVGSIRVWAGAEGMFHSFTEPVELTFSTAGSAVSLVLSPMGQVQW